MTEPQGSRFARWLSVSMDNRGISGRRLAKLLEFHDTSVSKWRTGESVPSVPTIMKIASIFQVSPSRLLVTARPEEFSAKDFGEPLDVPAKLAYRRRVAQYIRSLPLDAADARDLEELFTITQMMREDPTQDGDLDKIAAALQTIRKVISGRIEEE